MYKNAPLFSLLIISMVLKESYYKKATKPNLIAGFRST